MLFDWKTRKVTSGDGRELPALSYDTVMKKSV